MDAILYSKYHGLQNKDTFDFLLKSSSIRDWDNLTDEVVMDIGCGPGNTSCKNIISIFPHVRRIIGVDILDSMISLANVLNPHPKIEYWVADILENDTLDCWEGTISKVISTWTFQYLQNQECAFRNVYELLKPGGEAAVFLETSSPYNDCCKRLLTSSKWKGLFKDHNITNNGIDRFLDSQSGNSEQFPYQRMLEGLGFVEVTCSEEYKSFTYPSDDEFRGFVAAACSFACLLPCELRDEFSEDLVQNFVKCCGRTINGRLITNYTTMSILAKKPCGDRSPGKDLLC